MLAASGLVDQIKNAMAGRDPADGSKLQADYCNAVKTYLEANMQIKFVCALVNPTGVPDPINAIGVTGTIKFPAFTFLPAPDLTTMGTLMHLALIGGIITLSDPSVVVPPIILNPAGQIILTPTGSSDPDISMNILATQILAGIQTTHIFPAPVPAVHAAFTGVITMAAIL